MFRRIVAAALLAGMSVPASAMTYLATVRGTMTEQFATMFTAPGATSPIKAGDTITATFTYLKIETAAEAMAAAMGKMGPKVTFSLDGYTWTSAGDFMARLEPVSFDPGLDPLAGYVSAMDDAKGAGDLKVNGYAFEIGEFGYDLYTGPGFRGSFDKSTLAVWINGRQVVTPAERRTAAFAAFAAPVPEPTLWALMIGGFGLVGAALRRRRPHTQISAVLPG